MHFWISFRGENGSGVLKFDAKKMAPDFDEKIDQKAKTARLNFWAILRLFFFKSTNFIIKFCQNLFQKWKISAEHQIQIAKTNPSNLNRPIDDVNDSVLCQMIATWNFWWSDPSNVAETESWQKFATQRSFLIIQPKITAQFIAAKFV